MFIYTFNVFLLFTMPVAIVPNIRIFKFLAIYFTVQELTNDASILCPCN